VVVYTKRKKRTATQSQERGRASQGNNSAKTWKKIKNGKKRSSQRESSDVGGKTWCEVKQKKKGTPGPRSKKEGSKKKTEGRPAGLRAAPPQGVVGRHVVKRQKQRKKEKSKKTTNWCTRLKTRAKSVHSYRHLGKSMKKGEPQQIRGRGEGRKKYQADLQGLKHEKS